MKKKISALLAAAFTIAVFLPGCGGSASGQNAPESGGAGTSLQAPANATSSGDDGSDVMRPTEQITKLANGFSMVRHEGDYGFDTFIAAGGAASDADVVQFLVQNGLQGAEDLSLQASGFGCSTLAAKSPDGGMLFGRNFDWEECNALVVSSSPTGGYASVSTVNLDFLGSFVGLLPERTRTLAALYAPLDGINEKGLAAAVLMISDPATIEQSSEKPDITTTTAIRLLLDKAATVDEAVALLGGHDMHASMGMMVHFALADATGKSVVVEYVGNEMTVIETPVVTNFYLADGEKNGIGSDQSHTRFDILVERLAQTPAMDMDAVRDAMQSVSKQNFGEFESTEWSIVYDLSRGAARYYHRENYQEGYTFIVE